MLACGLAAFGEVGKLGVLLGKIGTGYYEYPETVLLHLTQKSPCDDVMFSRQTLQSAVIKVAFLRPVLQ